MPWTPGNGLYITGERKFNKNRFLGVFIRKHFSSISNHARGKECCRHIYVDPIPSLIPRPLPNTENMGVARG